MAAAHRSAPPPDPRNSGNSRPFVFRRGTLREVDLAAIKDYALPGIVLMENAASALRDECLHRLATQSRRAALLLCGPGNNGGDGLALARKLHNDGLPVAILLLGAPEDMKGDAAVNVHVVQRMGLRIDTIDQGDPTRSCDAAAASVNGPSIVVDALFGTGLDRPLAPLARTVVGWMNALRELPMSRRPVILSVDIPSGLDCDTGRPLGDGADAAVRADVTVTLAGLKIGFAAEGAGDYLGDVVVGDIGVPIELLARFAEKPN